MDLELIESIRSRAKAAARHIVLPEGYDQRVMAAAQEITKSGMARITLLGQVEKLQSLARERNIDLDGITLADPGEHHQYEEFAEEYYMLRRAKGVTRERAYEVLKSPILFGVMMLKNDMVDGMVAGAAHPTADVLRPAFRIIRTKACVKLASAAFIMVTPKSEFGENGVLVIADGAVNPVLTPSQMADVAYSTARTARDLLHFAEPRVAMISYSTMGSANHAEVDKVIEATNIAKAKYPDLIVDGEMQIDAAVSRSVAALKAPDSPVAGRANILIFPDLTSANACYKAVQRFGDAKAVGPLLQGMAKPLNDLSRGCTVEEVINTVAVVCCS